MSEVERESGDQPNQMSASEWLDQFTDSSFIRQGRPRPDAPTLQLPRVEIDVAENTPAQITPMRTSSHATHDASSQLGHLLATYSDRRAVAFQQAPVGAAITGTVLAEIGVDPKQLDRSWYRDANQAVWVKVGEPTEAILYGGTHHGRAVQLTQSRPWDQHTMYRNQQNPAEVWRATPIRDRQNRLIFLVEELEPTSRLRRWTRGLFRRRATVRHQRP